MKNVILLAVVAVIGFTSMTVLKPTTFKLDATKSTIKWTGKKVTGSHWGYIKFADGQVSVENNAVVGGTFTMDMTSIDDQDAKGGMGDKLVGHLKSDDFFSVEKFPKGTLVLKSVTPKSGNDFDVKADLTLKGTTAEITFPATIAMNGKDLSVKASFPINRTKFGIKYGSGSFFDNLGDKAISDDFTVDVDATATADAMPTPAAVAAPVVKKKKKKKA